MYQNLLYSKRHVQLLVKLLRPMIFLATLYSYFTYDVFLQNKNKITLLKTIWRRKDLLHLNKKSGKETKSGTIAEAMEKCVLLTCSSWLLSLLSYIVQDHLLMDGTTFCGPAYINLHQENALQSSPQTDRLGAFSQLRFPLLK